MSDKGLIGQRRAVLTPVALVIAVLMLVSCAGPVTGTPAGGSGSPPDGSTRVSVASVVSVAGLPDARRVPLLTPVTYANAGYVLTPPPASAVAKVTPATAYATCLVDAVCVVGGHPSIKLAVVSQDGVTGGGTMRSDGTVTPFLTDTLTWVIIYTGQPCPQGSHGAGMTSASTPTATSAPTMCTIINFIAADSGKVIMSVEGVDL